MIQGTVVCHQEDPIHGRSRCVDTSRQGNIRGVDPGVDPVCFSVDPGNRGIQPLLDRRVAGCLRPNDGVQAHHVGDTEPAVGRNSQQVQQDDIK